MTREGAAPGAGVAQVLGHPLVARLARRLAARAPVVAAGDALTRHAAVALVLRIGGGGHVELLLIERAARDGDPWSGHMALPGGRHQDGESLLQTAVRETREETALDLDHDGAILGQLDDVAPRTVALPPLVITPFVAATTGAAELRCSDEVADAFWMPVEELRAPGVAHDTLVEVAGGSRRVPCFEYRGHIIWGLTERVLQQFLALTASD